MAQILKDMKQKLWIVSEMFYPNEVSTSFILTHIANRMTSKYDVNILCCSTNEEKTESFSINKHIKILRLPFPQNHSYNLAFRILRSIYICLGLCWKLLIKSSSHDKVLIVTNPVSLVLLISVIKFFRKFELSILVHDVFPENTISAHLIHSKKSLIYLFFKTLFDRAYANADKIIVLGHDMKKVIAKKVANYGNPQITIIPNWADLDQVHPITRKNKKIITIQYSGNLGRVQGIIELLDFFKKANNKNIQFNIWGKGALEKNIKSFIKKNPQLNIKFKGKYNRSQQTAVLNDCDLSIITLADGMYGLGVPSKSYNIMASGKPILFIGPTESEIALLVKKANIGFVFAPSEKDAIIDFLRKINIKDLGKLKDMGNNARKLAINEYSRDKILNNCLNFI